MLDPVHLRRWGLHTSGTLRARAHELGSADYLIKGILPVRSIGLLVGDSGLGKSPFMYQAAISIAAGLPFLGRETRKGTVVIADFENGLGDMDELVDRISRYLGLSEPPSENLLLWSLNDCQQRYGQPGDTLVDMLRIVRPSLAIIDSLASYMPEAEEKNSSVTKMLQELRALARDCATTVQLVHHRRKQSRKAGETAGPSETAILRQWFQDSRGASALVNGVDLRLGMDLSDLSPVTGDDSTIVVRGFGRIRGDIGPLYLTRDYDEESHPLGYRVLTGEKLLFNLEQEKAYAALPQQFSTKQARQTYGRQDQATSDMLRKCLELNLVRKLGRGQYAKVAEAQDTGVGRSIDVTAVDSVRSFSATHRSCAGVDRRMILRCSPPFSGRRAESYTQQTNWLIFLLRSLRYTGTDRSAVVTWYDLPIEIKNGQSGVRNRAPVAPPSLTSRVKFTLHPAGTHFDAHVYASTGVDTAFSVIHVLSCDQALQNDTNAARNSRAGEVRALCTCCIPRTLPLSSTLSHAQQCAL